MAVQPFAVDGEQVALADAVEEAQAERLFQLGDLPRHGAVLHVQRGSGRGQRFFFHQRGEVADAVPVEIHRALFPQAGFILRLRPRRG